MTSEERRRRAGRILPGLLSHLAPIGAAHVIGSCRVNKMAWNDIEIDVLNTHMTIERLHELTRHILKAYHPLWYEAKEEVNGEGKTVWFHGFDAEIDGELWNFAIGFFDAETIERAERYCDRVASLAAAQPHAREAILRMKQDLIAEGLYGFEQYSSMDVYRAVLKLGITDTQALKARYSKPSSYRMEDF